MNSEGINKTGNFFLLLLKKCMGKKCTIKKFNLLPETGARLLHTSENFKRVFFVGVAFHAYISSKLVA